MRKQLTVLGILLHLALPAPAQVSFGFGFGFQSDNISISLSSYPNLVRVPGYPVYYATGLNSNYFFYDGLYWVFETDRWYSSSWYNGPWMMVDPAFIPAYLLQVPVRYYRRPPSFFVGWQANSSPRWNEHWGDDWARQRSGWDRRNRQAMPAPAPLPTYQRQYAGDRYPSAERQSELQNRNYRHEPAEVSPRGHAAPAAERQRPASPALIKEKEPTITPQAPNPQREQDGREPERQQQERPMRPQPESNRQRGAQPSEERSAPPSADPGQRGPQRDNADERGQGRGRRE